MLPRWSIASIISLLLQSAVALAALHLAQGAQSEALDMGLSTARPASQQVDLPDAPLPRVLSSPNHHLSSVPRQPLKFDLNKLPDSTDDTRHNQDWLWSGKWEIEMGNRRATRHLAGSNSLDEKSESSVGKRSDSDNQIYISSEELGSSPIGPQDENDDNLGIFKVPEVIGNSLSTSSPNPVWDTDNRLLSLFFFHQPAGSSTPHAISFELPEYLSRRMKGLIEPFLDELVSFKTFGGRAKRKGVAEVSGRVSPSKKGRKELCRIETSQEVLTYPEGWQTQIEKARSSVKSVKLRKEPRGKSNRSRVTRNEISDFIVTPSTKEIPVKEDIYFFPLLKETLIRDRISKKRKEQPIGYTNPALVNYIWIQLNSFRRILSQQIHLSRETRFHMISILNPQAWNHVYVQEKESPKVLFITFWCIFNGKKKMSSMEIPNKFNIALKNLKENAENHRIFLLDNQKKHIEGSDIGIQRLDKAMETLTASFIHLNCIVHKYVLLDPVIGGNQSTQGEIRLNQLELVKKSSLKFMTRFAYKFSTIQHPIDKLKLLNHFENKSSIELQLLGIIQHRLYSKRGDEMMLTLSLYLLRLWIFENDLNLGKLINSKNYTFDPNLRRFISYAILFDQIEQLLPTPLFSHSPF